MIEEDHIWVCAKNDVDNSEYVLFKESISEMIASVMVMDKDKNRIKEFERNLLEIAVQKSKLMTTENLLREVTRVRCNKTVEIENKWCFSSLGQQRSAVFTSVLSSSPASSLATTSVRATASNSRQVRQNW
ncbi:unnamed protein product [Rhizophagus irregularis]|uniref:Uncharacterized protein n=1 Tax=Rhizophagus irregularis TaxID=588596 RepID=A0A915Z176_9GLOM|nr:unnamed protein product [Rhizophagus irregularis]